MKEKIVAALLAFFLGPWGIHWFYLDDREMGKKYLIWCVVGILTCWFLLGLIPLLVLTVLSLVDCFKFLFMTDDEFNEAYNKKKEEKTQLND